MHSSNNRGWRNNQNQRAIGFTNEGQGEKYRLVTIQQELVNLVRVRT